MVSPPSVTTNAGTRKRLIDGPLRGAADDADRQRRERSQVGRIACVDAGADREPVGQAAFSDIGADDARERHQRADRQVDAPSQDDEGHPDGDQPGDRHLAQHIQQVARVQEVRLQHREHDRSGATGIVGAASFDAM